MGWVIQTGMFPDCRKTVGALDPKSQGDPLGPAQSETAQIGLIVQSERWKGALGQPTPSFQHPQTLDSAVNSALSRLRLVRAVPSNPPSSEGST